MENALDRAPRSLPPVNSAATLAEQLYSILEQAIIDGTLSPGERLHADELAKYFGVSRIPVRETLRALDANGWIEIRPRHGTYVRKRSSEELSNLFEVRSILEVEAAQLAAQRRTDEQLTELFVLVDHGHECSSSGDLRGFAEANRSFHELVAQCAANDVLAKILHDIGLRVRWYFATVSLERSRHSTEEHALMVRALQLKDGTRAATLARSHVEATREVIQDKISTEIEAAHGQ